MSERGRALVDVYPASVHDGGPDHFRAQILPDDRLVVANGDGLLLFDGAGWRMYRHPQRRQPLHELAFTPDGRFYAGFPDDIGYFAADGRGDYAWTSLSANLPPESRGFGVVIALLHDAGRDNLVFVATGVAIVMARAHPERITLLHPRGAFTGARRVDDTIWLHDTRSGLVRIGAVDASAAQDLRLEPIAGTVDLDGTPAGIGTVPNGHVLMLSNGKLLRLHDGATEPIATSHWDTWRDLSPSYFAALRDGNFAIGFRRAPPWIIDAEGHVLERYDELADLPGVAPRGFAEDRMGGLWVSQANSLWRINRGSAVTLFRQAEGVPRTERLTRWRGTLYLATGDSLSQLRPATAGRAARFEVIPSESLSKAWAVEVIDDHLVVVGNGIFLWDDSDARLRRVLHYDQLTSFDVSRFHPGHAYAGTDRGVVDVDFSALPPTGALIPDSPTTAHGVFELDADTLWISSRSDESWESVRESGLWQSAHRHAIDAGVPAGPRSLEVGDAGQAWLASSAGVLLRDPRSGRFERPPGLPRELLERQVSMLSEDRDGNLWAQTSAGAGVAWRTDSAWHWDESVLRPLDRTALMSSVRREGRIAWIYRSDGLVRIDLSRRLPLSHPALPRIVSIENLRNGELMPLDLPSPLAPDQRDLRLGFALPAFERPDLIQFRTRLDGYEAQWSAWSTRNEREYTNLPDGKFRLELEGRDAFDRVSIAEPMRFSITPPWWRTVWARAATLAFIAASLWLAFRFGARRRMAVLQARQRELEDVVGHRTRELQLSNQQLADQAEHLAEIDRLKTRFFINVGHEFRTPLSLVLGPLDDLLRDARERFSLHAREQIAMANRNARRVLDLIIELLDVNRFEHGRMQLKRVPTELQSLARRTLLDHQALLDRHGHEGGLSVVGDGPWWADLDPIQIERALGNLICNAAKYMARGGRVQVRLQRLGNEIELAVIDQGRGIAAAALPHIYDRFFQAEGSDREGGSGIGLALVREIVESHQGRVGVRSEPGAGSTFLLMLPAMDASTERAPETSVESIDPGVQTRAQSAADEVQQTPRRGRPRVLVVDDHEDLRKRLRDLLSHRFDVIEAADGPGAWNAARAELPDLIVCDLMMPGFDGIELTRRVRADAETETIALLLLTAKAGSDHAVTGLRAGADDYLAKPFDSSELLARIDALLARAQRLRLRLVRERETALEESEAQTPDERWRRRLDSLIAERLDDPALSVEQLATAMHADRSQLFRRCKELLGMPPSDYLREIRLSRAHELLERQVGTVSEVAYAVGFDSLSSFTRAFKVRYAIPPSRVPGRKVG